MSLMAEYTKTEIGILRQKRFNSYIIIVYLPKISRRFSNSYQS